MFKPLGMQHTHFHHDYGFLVKNRANSYGLQPGGGYRYVALSYSNVGATSLFTTVGDLAKWDENFYTGAVGGKELIAQMQVKGKLNNGQEIPYASGISTREYRGLKVVEHSGGDAAFRSHFMRFPEQHFSAIVLCNAGDAPTTRLAQQVADIYLKAELKPASDSSTTPADAAKPVEVKIDPKVLDAYVGEYMLPPNTIISFMRNGDQLMTQAPGQPPFQVFPSSETSFFPKQFEALITFERPAADGKSAGFKLRQGGRDLSATRMERARPTPERLNAYAGTFFSGELNALYFVSARDGKLSAAPTRRDRGVAHYGRQLRSALAGGHAQIQLRRLEPLRQLCNRLRASEEPATGARGPEPTRVAALRGDVQVTPSEISSGSSNRARSTPKRSFPARREASSRA